MLNTVLILLFGLLFLASCEGEPKLSSISQITTTITTNTNFPGGVIIVGTRTDAPGSVSFASPDGSNISFAMERGDWTFYGVGYSGNASNEKLTGATSCGMASASFRGGKSSSVNLSFSTDGCSGALSRALQFKVIKPLGCRGFYSYNASLDTFTLGTSYTGTVCDSVPYEQGGASNNVLGYKNFYYKVFAVNSTNGKSIPVFGSSCMLVQDGRNLPSATMPFVVRLYRSQSYCQNNIVPHSEFNFGKGIASGNPSEFDSTFQYWYTQSGVEYHALVLPESINKRYRSPFMEMIPRILCGTETAKTDCVPTTNMNSYPLPVPWTGKRAKQLILTDANTTSCDGLTTDSTFFTVSDCEIRNKYVYASIKKNELACNSGEYESFSVKVRDMYARGRLIYLLLERNGIVYFQRFWDGVLYNEVQVDSTDTTWKSIAADEAGNVYIISPSWGLKKFSLASNLVFNTATTNYTNVKGDHFEISADGNIGYFAVGNQVKAVDPNGLLGSPLNFGAGDEVNQLHLKDGFLYVGVKSGTNYFIYRNTLNSDYSMPNAVTNVAGGGSVKYFSIDGNKAYMFYSGVIYDYHIKSDGMWQFDFPSSYTNFAGSDRVLVKDSISYQYVYDSSSIQVWRFRNGTWTSTGEIDSDCVDNDVTISLGTASAKFNFDSKFAVDNRSANSRLFETALTNFGIRSVYPEDFYTTAIPSFSDDQQNTRIGGHLSRAQRLLGTHGVGGLLSSEFTTCENVRDIAGLSAIGFTRNFGVNDSYLGYRSFQVKAEKINEPLSPPICDNSSQAMVSNCSAAYDLKLTVTHSGTILDKESYVLRLKCGQKIGELNYLLRTSTEEKKEYVLWNTMVLNAARAEHYLQHKKGNDFIGSVTSLKKTGLDTARARTIQNIVDYGVKGVRVVDYEINSSQHMATRKGYTSSDFSGALYIAEAPSTTHTGNAAVCLPRNSASINDAPISTCTMATQAQTTSLIQNLSLSSMEDAETPTSNFQQAFPVLP